MAVIIETCWIVNIELEFAHKLMFWLTKNRPPAKFLSLYDFLIRSSYVLTDKKGK